MNVLVEAVNVRMGARRTVIMYGGNVNRRQVAERSGDDVVEVNESSCLAKINRPWCRIRRKFGRSRKATEYDACVDELD